MGFRMRPLSLEQRGEKRTQFKIIVQYFFMYMTGESQNDKFV